MIVRATAGTQAAKLAALNALVANAYDGGLHDLPGITSSTAAADANFLTTVAVIDNSLQNYSSFAGVNGLDTSNGGFNQVLLKYTWYGDADGNGQVTGDDYNLIDTGFSGGGTWPN